MKTFLLVPIICCIIAFGLLIVHWILPAFSFNLFGQNLTLYDIATPTLCVGLILTVFTKSVIKNESSEASSRDSTSTK